MELTNAQHAEQLEKRDLAIEQRELVLISTLGLTPTKDGNQWCFLYGEDLQTGVAGFGDTVRDAMIDFNHNFYTETITIVKHQT